MPVDFRPKKVSTIELRPTTEEGALDLVSKKIKATISGINQLIPFSDQVIGASATARQLLSGDINYKDIEEAYTRNVRSSLELKQRLAQEEPIATGIGMGLGASGETLVTGGFSPIARAATGVAQAAGIAGGQTAAAGGTAPEVGESAAYGGLLGTVMSAIPQAKSEVKGLISKLRQKFSGLTPEEQLGRSALKVLGASKAQATELVEESPELAKALQDEGILRSGLDAKTKLWKRAQARKEFLGEQLESTYKEIAQPVTEDEIAQRIRLLVQRDIPVTPRTKELRQSLYSTANEFDKGTRVLSPTEAWKERVDWDLDAFKYSKSFARTGQNATKSQEAQVVRDAIQDALDDRIAGEMGSVDLEALKGMNQRYSNISKIEELTKSGQFDKTAGPLDRLTIGSAIAARSHPIIAGALYGGREAARFIGPKAAVLGNAAPGIPSPGLVAPIAAATQQQEVRSPIFSKLDFRPVR